MTVISTITSTKFSFYRYTEVDKCRPFFCCILGERYGWYSNPQKPDPLLQLTFQKASQNYPWVMKYLTENKRNKKRKGIIS